MKRKIFYFIFSIVCSLALSAQERNCHLWLNDIPFVADTTSQTLYITIEPQTPDALQGTLRWDSYIYNKVSVNGNSLSNGETSNFLLENWGSKDNVVSVCNNDGRENTWKLVCTTLPIILLEADQGSLYETWKDDDGIKTPSFIQVIDARCRTRLKDTDVEGLPMYASPIGIRVRGATSAGKEKKSFAIELRDSLGEESDVHLLGYRKDGDWILDAMFNDYSRMRNRLLTDIWNSIDDLPYAKDNSYQRNGTDGEFVEVFMHGKYHGLYCFTDKIDRKKLNLKKLKEATSTLPEQNRGLLWKSTFRCEATSFTNYKTNPKPDSLVWENYWEQKYPDERNDQGDFSPIAALIDVCGKYASSTAFSTKLDSLVYMDNLVDYVCFTQAFQLMDNLQKNMYLSVQNLTKGSRLLITPWDLDASMGRDAGGDPLNTDKKWLAFGEQLGGINYLIWRLASKRPNDFADRLNARWQYLKTHEFSLESVRNRMERYAYLFNRSGAWQREYDFSTVLRASSGKKAKMANTPDEEVEFMMEFLTRNYEALDAKVASWNPAPYIESEKTMPRALYVVENDDVASFEGNEAVVPGTVIKEPLEGDTEVVFEDSLMTINRESGASSYNVGKIKEVTMSASSDFYHSNAFVPKEYKECFDFDTHYGCPGYNDSTAYSTTTDFVAQRTIEIKYDASKVYVSGNLSGISVLVDGSNVSIDSPLQGVNYVLSGTSSSASLVLNGTQDVMVTFDNCDIANQCAPVICSNVGANLYLNSTKDSRNMISGVSSLGDITLVGEGVIQIITEKDSTSSLYSLANVSIKGGVLNIYNSAFDGKGIRASKNINVEGGNSHIIMTGSGNAADDALAVEGTQALLAEKTANISNGSLTVKTLGRDGGVGIACLDKCNISGGRIMLACFDDPINAVNAVQMSGGEVFATSQVDDGLDSNGSITITGGKLFVVGSYPNEGAFDNDGKTFIVNGGTVIGIGTKSDAPYASKSSQAYLLFKKSAGMLHYIKIVDEAETEIAHFETPAYTAKGTIVFSSPSLVKGNKYTMLTSDDDVEYKVLTTLSAQ